MYAKAYPNKNFELDYIFIIIILDKYFFLYFKFKINYIYE